MKRIRLAALLAAFAPILVTVGEPDSAATAAQAPVVILKFDDLTQKGADKAKGEAVSSNFEAVADIVRRLGVKASFGIICNSLESGTPEYFDWIRARRDEGLFEFWCHGLTHAEHRVVGLAAFLFEVALNDGRGLGQDLRMVPERVAQPFQQAA